MRLLDLLGLCQIGNRPRHAQDAVVASGAQGEARECSRHQGLCLSIEQRARPKRSARSRRVQPPVARHLTRPRGSHPRAHRFGRFAGRRVLQLARRDASDANEKVEPVAKRPGQARGIARDLRRRTAAGAGRVAEKTARTRIHRANQHEPRGEDRRPRRPGNRTEPSSSGCRRTSSTCRLNSGISSRNSTPWCARLISPGRGCCPPPTSATSEIV